MPIESPYAFGSRPEPVKILTKVWRLRASGLLSDDSRHFLKVFGETFKICSAYSLSVSEKASLWSRRSLTIGPCCVLKG